MASKIYIVLIVMCAVISTQCAAQTSIPLPDGHEAYDMLETLATKGLAPGYSAEHFRIRKDLTREEAAQAVIAITDSSENNPAAFSIQDIELLAELRHEFRFELEKAGDTRSLDEKLPRVKTPPSHWAYSALETVAEKGLAPGYEAEDFKGRVLTRVQLARAVASAAVNFSENPAAFDADDVEKLWLLEIEFAKELKLIKPATLAAGPLQRAAKRSRESEFIFSGTSYMLVSTSKGNKSTVSNRISMQGGINMFDFIYSGTIDNSGDQGVEIDFGREYVYETDRKTVFFHSAKNNPGTDAYLVAGDVKNLRFAQGLLLGAANITGIMASAPVGGEGRLFAASGDDTSGEQLYAMRYESAKTSAGTQWGMTVAGTPAKGAGRETALSLDFSGAAKRWKFVSETVADQSGGRGVFMRFNGTGPELLKLKFEYRNYKEMLFENNNPAKYSGRSGSAGESEKGYMLAAEWHPGKEWKLLLNRDRKSGGIEDPRTNLFWAVQYAPDRRWTYALGWEKERGAAAAESERTARFRFRNDNGATFSASWKRALAQSGPSSTSRLDLSLPVIGESARMFYSFTRRTTSAGRTDTSRMRLNRELDGRRTFSLSYDYSAANPSRMDASLTWKF